MLLVAAAHASASAERSCQSAAIAQMKKETASSKVSMQTCFTFVMLLLAFVFTYRPHTELFVFYDIGSMTQSLMIYGTSYASW
jgi:hypothetical protein